MKRIKSFALKVVDQPWFFPLALLAIGFVAYGLMIHRLGFYWDDWESVYLYKLHNPGIDFQYFSERPFSALIYFVLFPVARMTPLVWQSIALILRWAGVLFVYFTLDTVWPERKSFNRWIAAILFVFPGFFQQPVAVCNSRHFITFFLFALSLFLTVLALKNRKLFWLWMPLSVLFGIAQIFMMEYFVGLEIIRLFIIWVVLQAGQDKKRIPIRTFAYWLPFLIGLGVYAWWRFFYIPTTLLSDPNNPSLLKSFLHSPLESLLSLVIKIYGDTRYLMVDIWMNAFYNPALYDLHAKILWLAWFLGILVAILFGIYVKHNARQDEPTSSKLSNYQVLFLGLVALLAGGLPIWATDRQVNDGKWSDRFALAPMVGIAILLVFLIDWFFRTHKQKQWLLVLLLGFSISAQIWNDNSYRLDWDLQRNLYWQLAWRIPSLKPGTAIIGKGTFTDKSSYYDATYIVNLLFDKQVKANPQYAYFDVFHLTPDNFKPNIPITAPARSGQFSGNTSQVVGMYFDLSGGCVRLLDPVYADDSTYSKDFNSLVPVSNLDQVVPSDTPTSPDPDIFGMEPAHGWCYYFEKADLARQLGDWQTVLQLGSEAESKGLAPMRGAEYIPFIEANAKMENWPDAFALSQAAFNLSPYVKKTLCNSWNRFSWDGAGSDLDGYLAQARTLFCVVAAP
jgi:hypothetical protein